MKILRQTTNTLKVRKNGRSSDFVSPNFIYGCLGSCMKWPVIFKNFVANNIKPTFATKYPSKLTYAPVIPKSVRCRISLMPAGYAEILEPKCDDVYERVRQINILISKGYEVHINFSPIIVKPHWLKRYKELFIFINDVVYDDYKQHIKCECIFLTHNQKVHERNTAEVERLLWIPDIQEKKTSEYGSDAVRYQWQLKEKMKQEFINLHQEIIPWCEIRYIF